MKFSKKLGLAALLMGMYAGPLGTLWGNTLDTSNGTPNSSNTFYGGLIGYSITISTVLLALKYRKDLFNDDKI